MGRIKVWLSSDCPRHITPPIVKTLAVLVNESTSSIVYVSEVKSLCDFKFFAMVSISTITVNANIADLVFCRAGN